MAQEYALVDFTNPAAFAWWRDAHAKLFADGVDAVMTGGDDEVPDDAIAFNGDAGLRLHNVYPLLYGQCVFEAAARFQREPGALPIASGARAGPAASATRFRRATMRSATGRGSPRRSAGRCRGG